MARLLDEERAEHAKTRELFYGSVGLRGTSNEINIVPPGQEPITHRQNWNQARSKLEKLTRDPRRDYWARRAAEAEKELKDASDLSETVRPDVGEMSRGDGGGSIEESSLRVRTQDSGEEKVGLLASTGEEKEILESLSDKDFESYLDSAG